MTDDFYDLLEIPPDAPQDDVKDAYREKVRVYHPDVNDDDRARAQFTAVKKAYDILGDPVERQAYDRLGHETYVAKRTSGLPSPDVWGSDDRTTGEKSSSTDSDESEADDADATERRSGKTFTYDGSTAAGSDARSTRSKAAAGAASGATRTAAGATGTSTTSTAGGTAAGSSATGGSRTTGTTAGATGTAGNGRSSAGATGRETARSANTSATTTPGTSRLGDNPLTRWWRRQNFSLPLLWLSILVYVAGLAHFALENAAALEELSADLAAVGADPEGIRAVLSNGRGGLETPVAFVTGVELVAPPVEPIRWYAGLAGVVGLALVGVVAARLLRKGELRRPVTIDETIVVALALTASTTLAGGPLLAGAVLMPVLFGMIVRYTRRSPGWKPSYLYVLPVLAPAAGFAVGASGGATLAADLALFVLVPVAGALCLPVRAFVRKRYGV